MPDTNTLLLLTGVFGMFAFITAAIIAADKVVNLQKQANERLNPNGFHWQFFELTELPPGEIERAKKLSDLSFQKGMLQGAAIDGRLAAAAGLYLLVRWTFYPAAKKRALRAIGQTDKSNHEVVSALAKILKGRAQ